MRQINGKVRIGCVYPVKRPAVSNLGQIAGELIRLRSRYELGQEMSDLVDGGEFGNVWSDFDDKVEKLLASHGLSHEQYNDEVSARIRMNYNRYYTLTA